MLLSQNSVKDHFSNLIVQMIVLLCLGMFPGTASFTAADTARMTCFSRLYFVFLAIDICALELFKQQFRGLLLNEKISYNFQIIFLVMSFFQTGRLIPPLASSRQRRNILRVLPVSERQI